MECCHVTVVPEYQLPSDNTGDNMADHHSSQYQYRKIMKPLLERKRRARINGCLDELKELMEYLGWQSGIMWMTGRRRAAHAH